MSQPQVALFIRIRITEKKRCYKRPVFAGNGRLKALYAKVGDKNEYHPEGVYCLRYSEAGKRIWEEVGKEADLALTAQKKREQILRARQLGIQVVDEEKAAKTNLRDAITEYLDRVQTTRSKRTQNDFALMLPQFADVCGKKFLNDVVGNDLMDYASWLRKLGYADRTISNRVMRVSCFLKKYRITNLLDEADKRSLKFVDKVVDAYTDEELKALFAAATEQERLIFQLFLGSGCREAEVANATWRDVNFSDKTFVVHNKPKRGFRPKDKAERRIPLPDALIDALKGWRKTHKDSIYLFPNELGRPNGHLLRMLKNVAKRAGLNCGECFDVGVHKQQSCLTAPVCGKFELHKFRRSFATFHHEHGVPARTIQFWLGHENLETTLRYLEISDARSEQSRKWVNASFAELIS